MIQKLEKTEVNAKESFDKYSQLVSAQTSNSEDTSQLKNVRTTFNTILWTPIANSVADQSFVFPLFTEIETTRGDDQ